MPIHAIMCMFTNSAKICRYVHKETAFLPSCWKHQGTHGDPYKNIHLHKAPAHLITITIVSKENRHGIWWWISTSATTIILFPNLSTVNLWIVFQWWKCSILILSWLLHACLSFICKYCLILPAWMQLPTNGWNALHTTTPHDYRLQ